MAEVHDFYERLAYSQQGSDEGFWNEVYEQAFVGFLSATPVLGDSQAQRLGIDRLVFLSSGQVLRIDEKKRDTVYPDILLEYLSNDRTGAKGWIEKELQIDYLAYAFMPIKKVFLYPWQQLRVAWKRNGASWKKRYRNVAAQNYGYKTWSVAVPIEVLDIAIRKTLIVELDVDWSVF